MPSLISEKTPAGRRWRIRWREGGRGAKAKSSRRFDNKREAMDEMAALEARLASEKEIGNRILIPWQECCVRFWATKSGRYATEGKKALAKHTSDWPNTQSGTPAAMAALPLGVIRLARACLRWSWLHLGQPIDMRALKVAGTRKRAKHARAQLLPDDEVARLMDAATETSEGNGAIVHLVAVYGHRAENLVQLTADNFKKGRIIFRVKGGEEVAHPLLTETVERLAPLIKARPTGPIFINHLGVPWRDGQMFAAWFNHWFGVGYYQLKRAAISRWLGQGVDAKTIASITGHKTVSLLLDTYAQTNESRQAAAINSIKRMHRLQEQNVSAVSRVYPLDIGTIVHKTLK